MQPRDLEPPRLQPHPPPRTPFPCDYVRIHHSSAAANLSHQGLRGPPCPAVPDAPAGPVAVVHSAAVRLLAVLALTTAQSTNYWAFCNWVRLAWHYFGDPRLALQDEEAEEDPVGALIHFYRNWSG